MYRLINTVFLITAVMFTLNLKAQDMSLEKILDRYASAKGHEKFKQINTLYMEGLVLRHDVMPVIIYRSRPDKYMMKYDVADLTAYQVYDGEVAWHTMPWRGIVEPEVLSMEDSEGLRKTAIFDDILLNFEKNKYQLTLTGKDEIDNIICYVLELKNLDNGQKELYYINSQTFLLYAIISERITNETTHKLKTVFKEYREVGGVYFSFITEVYVDGQLSRTTEYDNILPDIKLSEDFFSIDRVAR